MSILSDFHTDFSTIEKQFEIRVYCTLLLPTKPVLKKSIVESRLVCTSVAGKDNVHILPYEFIKASFSLTLLSFSDPFSCMKRYVLTLLTLILLIIS